MRLAVLFLKALLSRVSGPCDVADHRAHFSQLATIVQLNRMLTEAISAKKR